MGTFKQGILGGFSGKVGPVIGSSWKGKAVMRAMALSYNDANTEAQKEQRAKFGLVSKLVAAMGSAVAIGFKSQANGMTEANAALKQNINEVVTGTYPNISIDLTKVVVSKGNLDNAYGMSATVDAGEVEITWTDNSGIGNALANDNINIVVYDEDRQTAYSDLLSLKRETRTASISLPSTWSGDKVSIYAFASRATGNETSNSLYLGTFTA